MRRSTRNDPALPCHDKKRKEKRRKRRGRDISGRRLDLSFLSLSSAGKRGKEEEARVRSPPSSADAAE